MLYGELMKVLQFVLCIKKPEFFGMLQSSKYFTNVCLLSGTAEKKAAILYKISPFIFIN